MSYLYMIISAYNPTRHQTYHFRKRATSAPAEGPACGLDFARRCEFRLRALRVQKWHVHRSSCLVPPFTEEAI